MKITYKNRNQSGIGIIEVMVALVVVSLGMLAIAALNGQLASSTGLGKARSEAVVLAELKLEELRNLVSETEFTAVTAGTTTETGIAGQNTTFTRVTTLSKPTSPDRIRALVMVSWGAATPDETIKLSGEYFVTDLGKVAVTSTPGSGPVGQSPSPKQNSSTEGAAPGQPDSYSPGTGTELGDGSGLYQHEDNDGNLVLLDSTGDVLQTFFGDVINRYKGTVYTVNDLDDISVNVSETGGYCWFTPSPGATSQEYICYIAGDCSNGGAGCPASPTIPSFVGPGGWYGVVGISGLGNQGGTQEKMCFPSVTGYAARAYKTVRTNGAAITSEGINEGYACQDFLIINENGQNSNCSTVTSNLGLSLAPQSIVRALNGDSVGAPNVVLAENTSFCGAVSSDCSTPWGSTVLDTASVTAYLAPSDTTACVSETRTCTAGTLSGSYTYETCSVIPSTDCTTPWGDTVAEGSSVTAYLSASDPSVCTSESRSCSAGVLSGSYQYDSCTVVPSSCTVPYIVGDNTSNAGQISTVNNKIIANGLTVGTATDTGSGQKKVQSQSPAGGSAVACGSAVNYWYTTN
jgi:hypothetical protein